MSKKEFSTLAVLSVTSGRLLTKPRSIDEGNGIGQMYELLGWMTTDAPFTHQLGRFADECKPWILRAYPELESVNEEIATRCDAGEVKQVQADMISRFGEFLSLEKIPRTDHDMKDPVDELASMLKGKPVIVVKRD